MGLIQATIIPTIHLAESNTAQPPIPHTQHPIHRRGRATQTPKITTSGALLSSARSCSVCLSCSSTAVSVSRHLKSAPALLWYFAGSTRSQTMDPRNRNPNPNLRSPRAPSTDSLPQSAQPYETSKTKFLERLSIRNRIPAPRLVKHRIRIPTTTRIQK